MRRSIGWMIGAGAALGSMAAANEWVRWRVGPVPRWVGGEARFYQWREGAVYYEAAGRRDAPPLILLHGCHAAASSYEMRRIFAPLAENFRVYLPDLLGFGRSDRPAMRYTADTVVDLWSDFARDVVLPAGDSRPAHVIASSLSCAHIVAAAARHPERFGRLLLICPTGIEALAGRPSLLQQSARHLLRSPILGTTLFNLLVSRASLMLFLRRQAYADPNEVTSRMVEDYFVTSHQQGAKWAPAAFVSGDLNCDIGSRYAALASPMCIVWGQAATVTPVSQTEAFRVIRPDVPIEVLERSALLPQDEEPEAFLRLAGRFFGT